MSTTKSNGGTDLNAGARRKMETKKIDALAKMIQILGTERCCCTCCWKNVGDQQEQLPEIREIISRARKEIPEFELLTADEINEHYDGTCLNLLELFSEKLQPDVYVTTSWCGYGKPYLSVKANNLSIAIMLASILVPIGFRVMIEQ